MKKLVIGLGILLLVVAALRRFGRPLEERAMEECQEMIDRAMSGREPHTEPKEPAVILAGR